MRLIALILARNEESIIEAAIVHARGWCDAVAVLAHGCTDRTADIAADLGAFVRTAPAADTWPEMDLRNALLQIGRGAGGTHFALVDADELLAQDSWDRVRALTLALRPREVLSCPMVTMVGPDTYIRSDEQRWALKWVPVAFADGDGVAFRPRHGYQLHSRVPEGAEAPVWNGQQYVRNVVMHFAFADRVRAAAKRCWYQLIERLQGPKIASALLAEYALPAPTPAQVVKIPDGWLAPGVEIAFSGLSWHHEECRRLVAAHPALATDAELDLTPLFVWRDGRWSPSEDPWR